MLCLTDIHWLPVYLAHRVRQAKDGKFREAYAPYLEDPRHPHRRRTLRVTLAVQ